MWRAKHAAMAEQLSRYWDARGSNQDDAAREAALAPQVTETIEQLYRHDDAQLPDPDFLNRLETTLMSTPLVALSHPSLTASAPFLPDGRAIPASRSPRPRALARGSTWPRDLLAPLATAALVVLVVVASLVAFGPGRPRRPDDVRAILPVVIATPATPTAAVTAEETLLEVTVPTELLPQGERITSEFSYLTMPAGSSGSWRGIARADWRGLRVHYVLDGSLTIRAEGAAHVMRAGAGSALEDVAADTEVLLGPGDTWMARNETAYEVDNGAAAPARLLSLILANIADPNTAYIYLEPGPWTIDFTDPLPPGIDVPAAPVKLRIRRLELPVEGRLPAPPGVILQQGVRPPTNAAGTPVIDPSVGTLRSGALVNIGRKPVTVLALSVEPIGAEIASQLPGTAVP